MRECPKNRRPGQSLATLQGAASRRRARRSNFTAMSEGTTAALTADVVIVGGGVVGLTLALALDQAGLSVIALDGAPPPRLDEKFDGRAFAIGYSSFRMWRALGLETALRGEFQRIEDILVTDGRTPDGLHRSGPSALDLHFDRREVDGPSGVCICDALPCARPCRPPTNIPIRNFSRKAVFAQPQRGAAEINDAARRADCLAGHTDLDDPIVIRTSRPDAFNVVLSERRTTAEPHQTIVRSEYAELDRLTVKANVGASILQR